MKQDNGFEMSGTVVDIKRGVFVVKVNDNGMLVDCTLSGKLRQNNIRILLNDKVDIYISVDDVKKGRITWRYK